MTNPYDIKIQKVTTAVNNKIDNVTDTKINGMLDDLATLLDGSSNSGNGSSSEETQGNNNLVFTYTGTNFPYDE